MSRGNVVSAEPVVCHINLEKGFRGGERQTKLLIQELSAIGWKQRLIVRNDSALLQHVGGIPSLEVVEVFPLPLAAVVAARGCCPVHVHEGRSPYAAWLTRIIWRAPYLLTRRVDNPFRKSFVRGRAYLNANAVVCVSAAIRDIVRASYPQTDCTVIPDAHAGFSASDTAKQNIRGQYPGKTLLGHVGALVQRHKGQMTIIEAARTMQHSHPDVHFLLLGSGGDEQMMKNSAKGLPNITFAGQVTNVADYLAAFDMFVFPSLMEGLGSSLLDAMHFGLPIVATNVGGIPEIVEDGVNGLLVSPGNSAQFVAAVERVLADGELRSAMRNKNREKADAYTAAKMAASYDALYRRMLPA